MTEADQTCRIDEALPFKPVRIAVLTVLDILATALMVRRGPAVLDRLRRAKLSVQEGPATPAASP